MGRGKNEVTAGTTSLRSRRGLRKEDFDRFIEEVGPWAYHITGGGPTRDKLLQNGVKPVGDDIRSGSAEIDKSLEGRPGHIYICAGPGVSLVADQITGWYPDDPVRQQRLIDRTIAIDLRALDPSLISPDEDACFESTLTIGRDIPPIAMPGASDPSYTVKDRFLVEAENETPEQFNARPYESYGQWAESEGLGSDPDHTYQCLHTFGSLAYAGMIPAHAIRECTAEDLSKIEESYPSQ